MHTSREHTKRLTVLLIPHSEHRVVSLRVHTLLVVAVVVVVAAVLIAFFVLSTVSAGSVGLTNRQDQRLEQTQSQLDALLAEVDGLIDAHAVFEAAIRATTDGLDLGDDAGSDPGVPTGDLSALLRVQQVGANELFQVQGLRRLRESLDSSVQPLEQIQGVLESQRALLADIPNLWPVIGARVLPTGEFGPGVNPIVDEWNLNNGIAIPGVAGMAVVSAANGKVTATGYSGTGLGVYVIIDHKYGFRTRYAHLQHVMVQEGQEVVQGQQLGTLGSTGLVVEPQVGFTVWFGTDVVDPAHFLKISNSFERWTVSTVAWADQPRVEK